MRMRVASTRTPEECDDDDLDEDACEHDGADTHQGRAERRPAAWWRTPGDSRYRLTVRAGL